jgi:hypothetical protein
MSDSKRSTAEFQRLPPDVLETPTPKVDATASRETRRLQRQLAMWQGAEERGGDPYNAVGRHVIGARTRSD